MSPSEASSSRPTLASAESAFSFETADLIEILEDLSTRFILNLPESESESIPRLCFQVEQAYWFYEDWVRDSQPNLPSYTLKRFSEIFFKVCPMLSKWSDKHERLFLEFMRYKTRVPVCGAVMINETWDKCVLVKGWKGNSWSFPKGKINQEEEKHICAIREVLEETGCDLINLLKTDDEYFHETTIQDQRITLYFVPGVPEDFPFETQTRKEIGAIEWFKLSDLPTWKKTKTTSTPKLAGKGKFYMILPFVLELKKFVKSHRPSSLKHSSSPLPTPISESALPTPLDEDPPSETEVSSTPVVPDSPAQLREAPVPLSELDELFARFLSSEREDRSRSASAAPRVDQDIEEEEDENEGTVMGASDELEQKPPTTSILDQMFGALTMPSAPPPPSPSNQFSPPPQANYPHPPQHLSQPQPQHASSLLSLFSNLPPPPPQQQLFQSRPPPNASLLALLNPSNPSPALYHSSPMYHHSQPSAPPTSSTSSVPQSNQPSLTNDKQSLLAMFSPPPSRSVPGAPSSPMPSNGQDQTEEARKKKKQMALLAMMDASLGGPGAGIGGGGPPPPPGMFNNGQSPMFQQQQPIYNQQPSPYVAQQLPMMPPNPHQSPYATNFPPRPPPNLNGGPPFPLNLNGPPLLFPNQQQQLNGHSPFQPHPQPSFGGGFPVNQNQSPRMMNFNNGGAPPPLPLGPGAPGPGAFHNGVPSYPGQMPNGFRGQPGGPGRPPLLPPSNFFPPGSNANSNGPPPPPPPPFLANPNAFQSPQRQQPPPQPYRGQPSLPPSNFPPLPPSNTSTNFPPLPSSSINKNDPFTVNPMLQQQSQKILSPPGPRAQQQQQQQQQQVPVPIHHPKPQGMTNHAESLLGMLKGGGGGGSGGKVASVNMPGYPSGSPAVGR